MSPSGVFYHYFSVGKYGSFSTVRPVGVPRGLDIHTLVDVSVHFADLTKSCPIQTP